MCDARMKDGISNTQKSSRIIQPVILFLVTFEQARRNLDHAAFLNQVFGFLFT